MKKQLARIWRIASIMFLPLYEKRKLFDPAKGNKGLKFKLFSALCQIKVIERNYVYDQAIHLTYELGTDIGQSLYNKGVFENVEIEFLQKTLLGTLINPVVLDIGANIGLHSIKFAKSNPDITIYAFEPSPLTRRILTENVKLNGLENKISIIPEAVSDHIGQALFFQTDDNAYSSLKDTKRKKVVNTTKVELTTIDHFISKNNLAKIDFIKIDVEGFDSEVLRGGLLSLKKFRPKIFIEIYKGVNSNPDPESTIGILLSIGYKAFILENGTLVPYTKHSDKMYNYYFIPG